MEQKPYTDTEVDFSGRDELKKIEQGDTPKAPTTSLETGMDPRIIVTNKLKNSRPAIVYLIIVLILIGILVAIITLN